MIIFSEYAWAKLRWFRVNCNENNVADLKIQNPLFLEVSLMGVSHSDEMINFIEDFICVPQEVSGGLTEPTDQGMMDYMEGMLLDRGISPLRCGRFWAHTHPGNSPTPSSTDNETFGKFFQHSDFAVMYILADGDDSCRVKHPTKYFGPEVVNMTTYVQYEAISSNGHPYVVNTKSLFAIDKIGISDGYAVISKLMSKDYSAYHPQWMEELKKNVKKKYGNHTTANTITSHNTQTTYPTTKRGKGRHNRIGFNNNDTQAGKGYGNTTNSKVVYPRYGAHELIKVLIDNNKENINQFDKKELKRIAEVKKIDVGDIQDTYNRVRCFENKFDLDDLVLHENDILTTNGESNFHNLTKEKLKEICCQLFIRPIVLKTLIEEYIKKVFQGEQI